MEEEKKTLGYDWEFGHEELMIEVDAYRYENRLYIGLTHMEDGIEESIADLTVNLIGMPVESNEAYIDAFASQSKLDFIRKHKLGNVLPEMGSSGMEKYHKVAFDLDRLAEFDTAGVERYRSLNEISETKQKQQTKKTEKAR